MREDAPEKRKSGREWYAEFGRRYHRKLLVGVIVLIVLIVMAAVWAAMSLPRPRFIPADDLGNVPPSER